MPSTIAEELKTNPFMRVDDLEFQEHMNERDCIALMNKVRELKNNF